ncbi:MAG: hypothetical protein NTW72_16020 [Gemmatimonadetes bacterium]|nr:hypothetical protein [Gemmatimonadota bacterium]
MSAGPRIDAQRVGVGMAVPDTTKVRRKAFRLSEAYAFRVRVHKVASYATLPLFVAEYAAGDQLFKKSSDAPAWARSSHGVLAGGVAGLFAINTLTGSLNWWETRGQEDGRTWRTVHSALMLLADAGFAATGALADGAEESQANRKLHRSVAVTSMSVAAVSYLMMLKPLRRD